MDNGKYWVLLDKTAVGPANNPKFPSIGVGQGIMTIVLFYNDATLSDYYFGDFLHSSIFTVLPS